MKLGVKHRVFGVEKRGFVVFKKERSPAARHKVAKNRQIGIKSCDEELKLEK